MKVTCFASIITTTLYLLWQRNTLFFFFFLIRQHIIVITPKTSPQPDHHDVYPTTTTISTPLPPWRKYPNWSERPAKQSHKTKAQSNKKTFLYVSSYGPLQNQLHSSPMLHQQTVGSWNSFGDKRTKGSYLLLTIGDLVRFEFWGMF